MNNRLIPYLLILVGLVGGYFYSSSLDPTAGVPLIPSNVAVSDLAQKKRLKVNYSILENEAYEDLRIFGPYPVPTSAPGKSNPFQ